MSMGSLFAKRPLLLRYFLCLS